MDRQPVFLRLETLRSPMIPAAAVLCALAALLGIPGVILIFNGDYAAFLLQNLVAGGITDASSLLRWRIINTAVTLLGCFGPCVMFAGLFLILRGRALRGVSFLSRAAHCLLLAVNISGAAALADLVFRLIRYTVYCFGKPNGLMLFYSMIISEALMIAQAAFLFMLIRKFLNCCIDSGTSIAYTLATGKLDSQSIPGFTSTGFLILAIFGISIGMNRLFTVTIVVNAVQSYYKLLVATHPAQLAEIGCLLCGSAANVLIFLYLRRYKRGTEKALFEAQKYR